MYLSRILINSQKHETMMALYNLEKLHGMVERSFAGERQRNLWRLDKLGGRDYLLLLSRKAPDTDVLPKQIGYEDSVWETKNYDVFLSRISDGTSWGFRLTANPTVCELRSGERGKVKAITVASRQREWLVKQSEKAGFSIKEGQFDTVRSEWKTFKKGNRENQILSVTFEGNLTVTDAVRFREVLVSGIGKEKAYGMGLLTVVPKW